MKAHAESCQNLDANSAVTATEIKAYPTAAGVARDTQDGWASLISSW